MGSIHVSEMGKERRKQGERLEVGGTQVSIVLKGKRGDMGRNEHGTSKDTRSV